MLKKHPSINDQIAPSLKNEGAIFTFFIANKSAKISASGQTCGQRQKMGLFNTESREEQAHSIYCENARFQEILRENKRKTRVRYEPSFWSE